MPICPVTMSPVFHMSPVAGPPLHCRCVPWRRHLFRPWPRLQQCQCQRQCQRQRLRQWQWWLRGFPPTTPRLLEDSRLFSATPPVLLPADPIPGDWSVEEIQGYCPRNQTKPNLSSREYLGILPVQLQRHQGDPSRQCSVLESIIIANQLVVPLHQPITCLLLKWLGTLFGDTVKRGDGSLSFARRTFLHP